MDSIDATVARLTAAWQDRRPGPPLDDLIDRDDAPAAWDVQNRMAARTPERQLAGWKVGLTSPAAMAMFGASEPMLGRIWADTILDDGAQLALGDCFQPRLEGELLLRIGRPLAPDIDDVGLRASIDAVMPAFEVAESRIAGWPRAVGHAIADNGCCGHVVMGAPVRPPPDLDFAALAMQLTDGHGTLRAQGHGADCLGSPLAVYRWFLGAAQLLGLAIRPGDLLLTGAMGAPFALTDPGRYRVALSGLGAVSLTVTA